MLVGLIKDTLHRGEELIRIAPERKENVNPRNDAALCL